MRNRNLPLWNIAAWTGILAGFGVLLCALWAPQRLAPLVSFISPNPIPSLPVREKLTTFLGWSGGIAGCAGLIGLLFAGGLKHALVTLGRDTGSALREMPGRIAAGLQRTGRLHLAALCLILLAGSLVRIHYMDEPVRMDEAQTYFNYAMRSPQQIISHYHSNNHTLHSLLVHATTKGPGPALWALRLPACAAGMLLLLATYLYGRVVYDEHTALLMTALAAGASYLIEFSILSRGYALQSLWLVAAFTAASLAVRHNRPSAWMSVGLLGVLSFATLVTSLYGFAAVCAWILYVALARYQGKARARRITFLLLTGSFTAICTILFYFPALVVVGLEEFTGNQYVTPLAWHDFVLRIPKFAVAYWALGHRDMFIPIQLAAALLALAGLAVMCRDGKSNPPAFLVALITCLPILLVQRRFPPARVWLFMLPLYFVLISQGLLYLARLAEKRGLSRVGLAIPALALLIGLAGVEKSWSSQTIQQSKEAAPNLDAEAMAIFLKSRLQPGDKVLIDSVYVRQYYYFQRHGLSWDYLDTDVFGAQRVFLLRLAHTNDGMILPYLHAHRSNFGEESLLTTLPYGGTISVIERKPL